MKIPHKVTMLILICALIFSLPGCSSHKPRTGEASIVEVSIAEALMPTEESMTVEESMSAEEFREIMEAEEFVVTEDSSSEQISEMFDVAVNECISVTQGDTTDPDAWFIYTILGSSEDAIKYFDGMVDAMEKGFEFNDIDIPTTLETSDDYSKYTAKGDGNGVRDTQMYYLERSKLRLLLLTLQITLSHRVTPHFSLICNKKSPCVSTERFINI